MKKFVLFTVLISFSMLLSAASKMPASTLGWYDIQWMLSAPYAPAIQVLDTESSLGPYAVQLKTITLRDLVQMHGHPCDGLVLAACALHFGLAVLYPDGVVDRTDTGIITNNSPCFGDVGEYLTSGRIRFGTQKIDPTMKNAFIIYRFSTGKAFRIALKPGILPKTLTTMEATICHGNKTLSRIRKCQALQLSWIRTLLYTAPEQIFDVRKLPEFRWVADKYEHAGKRGDVRMKSVTGKTDKAGAKNRSDIRNQAFSDSGNKLHNKKSKEESK